MHRIVKIPLRYISDLFSLESDLDSAEISTGWGWLAARESACRGHLAKASQCLYLVRLVWGMALAADSAKHFEWVVLA